MVLSACSSDPSTGKPLDSQTAESAAAEATALAGSGKVSGVSTTLDTAVACVLEEGECADGTLTGKNAVTLTFTATDSNQPAGEGVTFICSLDTDDFIPCRSPLGLKGLSDQRHTFRVSARDKDGLADPSPAKINWTVDTDGPTTTLEKKPAAISAKAEATFQFVSNDMTAQFECFLDQGDFVDCVSPHKISNMAQGDHTFQVRAKDAAGNRDPTPETFKWKVDSVPPDTSLAADRPVLTSSSTITITLKATDTVSEGGMEIQKEIPDMAFECSFDGADYAPCPSTWSQLQLEPKAHAFLARAVDAGGNVDATPAEFKWTIDTTPPDTSFTLKPVAAISTTNATFEFACTEPPCTFQCRLDGQAGGSYGDCWCMVKQPQPPPPAAPVPDEYKYEKCDVLTRFETNPSVGLSGGSHTFEVYSIDAAGNLDTVAASYTWTVDMGDPDTTITSQFPDSTKASATFTFVCVDTTLCTFECEMDGGGYTTCAPPKSYTLPDGSHTIRVRARDAADNFDKTPATQTWTIAAPPETTLIKTPATFTNLSSATFEFTSDDPTAQFECRVDAGAAGDNFGYSLSRAGDMDGDGKPDYIIGSPGADPFGLSGAGSAFIHSGANGNLMFRLDGAAGGAFFGYSVSGGQDVDADGFTDVVIGAYGADPATLTDAGSVYVYRRDPADQKIKLLVQKDGAAANDFFGYSVAMLGDVNGDGKADFLVGAYQADPATLSNAGSAYVYSGNIAGGAPLLYQKDGGLAGVNLGFAVASAGDVNMDGRDDFIIGAHKADPGGLTDAGSAYVYSGINGALLYQKDGAAANDFFGSAVASAGDANGDGRADFIVGAYAADPGGRVSAGSAYVYSGIDGTLLYQKDGTVAGDYLGQAVAGAGDVNGDGRADFMIGAPRVSVVPGTAAGRVFVYSGLDGSLIYQIDGAAAADSFGFAVSMVGDVNADARSEFMAGMYGADPGSVAEAGGATVYSGVNGTALYSMDRGAWITCISPKTYADLVEAQHRFEVRAYDTSGNRDASPALHTWTIDSTKPEAPTLTGTPTNPSTPNVAFSFTCNESNCTFECRLDSGAYGSCVSPKNYFVLSDGAHSFEVRAIDPAGNQGDPTSPFPWTVDAVPPDTSITSNPPALSNSSSADFSFTSNDGAATFECSLDNAIFVVCLSPKSYVTLAGGPHTFKVRAKDSVGNYDASPASYTWTVDVTAPQTTILTQPASTSSQTTATFTFVSDDTGATFQCDLDAGGYGACTSPKSYPGLLDGSHTFNVRATDAAGNVDATPATYTWTIDTIPPTAPTGLTATPVGGSASKLDLAWTDNSTDELGFVVQRKTGTNPYSDVASLAVNAVSHQDSGLTPSTSYTYRIEAQDLAGNKSYSNEVTQSTPADTTAPTFAGLTGLTALSDTSVKLTWTNATDDVTAGSSIVYNICRNVAAGGCAAVFTNDYTTTGCSPGPPNCQLSITTNITASTDYYFVVRAKDAAANQDANVVEKKRAYISSIASVSPGGWHTCARATNSTVKCWGENFFGQLGKGNSGGGSDSATAVQVSALATATSVVTGGWHTCALINDNSVQCWGLNADGQLGDNTTINKSIPVVVTSLTNVTAVTTGLQHSCALINDNTVKCWGANVDGQLGDGSTARKLIPTTVSTLATAQTVSAGDYHTCALLAGGTVQCWGDNVEGQLGDGSSVDRLFPVTVSTLATAADVSGGAWHTCARRTDNTAVCWGRNAEGQLGDGTSVAKFVPVQVSGLASAAALDTGGWHACTMQTDSTLRCWGNNSNGRLGNGSTTSSQIPVTVSTISTATTIGGGRSHTCAVLTGNLIRCWGDNVKGQVGRGFGSQHTTPGPVMDTP